MTYDLETSLLHQIRLASQALEASFAIANPGITFRQYIVLEAVEKLAASSQTSLVDMTGIDRSTMADIIGRMESRSLIRRRRNKLDGRAYQVNLTPLGRELLTRGREAARETDLAVSSSLPPDEKRRLLDLLKKLGETEQYGARPSSRRVADD